MTKQPPRRIRRTPEQARAEILVAAERAFERAGPDEVGIREVAARARVSHALVTHYFGTYEELVRAVLARRREAAVARLVGALPGDAGASVLDLALDFLLDPTRRRLRAWLDARTSAPVKQARRGIVASVAAAHANAERAALGLPPLSPGAVEQLVDVVLAAAQGLSPNETPAEVARFRRAITAVVGTYVRAAKGDVEP